MLANKMFGKGGTNMRKVMNILLVLVICMAMAITAFATNDDFVVSPGEGGTPCDHTGTVLVGGKNTTCSVDGYTGDLQCSDCGEILEEGSVILAPGHQLDANGVCVVCGSNDVPQTGDNNNMILWVGLMAVSAVALVAIVGIRRKKA